MEHNNNIIYEVKYSRTTFIVHWGFSRIRNCDVDACDGYVFVMVTVV